MSMQLNRVLKATALGSLLALVVAGPAHAVDGVIEINQARAKAGGVTPGDTPLFPVTISQPGSYRLTSNLDVTDATARPGGTDAKNVSAIVLEANGVTIDLNGFVILGPVTCSGTPTTCTPTGGSGEGVNRNFGGEDSAVLNGTIRGMGEIGINLSDGSIVEKVRAIQNGSVGIATNNGVVRGCTAEANGDAGINAGGVVTNNSSRNNGGDGVNAQNSTVTGNQVQFNGGRGIVGNNSVILDNVVTANTGVGLAGSGGTGYGNNVFHFNNSGGAQVSGGANQIGTNVCGGGTICP